MVQISTAAMRVLRLMEDLSLELYGDCTPDNFAICGRLSHEFLRPFGALRTLQVDLALIWELSNV
jgi:hypothetical protein